MCSGASTSTTRTASKVCLFMQCQSLLMCPYFSFAFLIFRLLFSLSFSSLPRQRIPTDVRVLLIHRLSLIITPDATALERERRMAEKASATRPQAASVRNITSICAIPSHHTSRRHPSPQCAPRATAPPNGLRNRCTLWAMCLCRSIVHSVSVYLALKINRKSTENVGVQLKYSEL